MTTAIIIVLLVGACVMAVKSYAKKLSHGCCGEGGDKERKLTKTADLPDCKYRYTVKIGGMICKNCAAKIENAFNRQVGIFAQADYKSGIAEISAKEPLPEIVVRQRIVGLGYSVEEIKQNEL
ncbi:MAG: ATPase P [Oscillospiraceae bacterium]|nr:ATPase P [Oscillospiraceae bacterium]